MKRLVVIAVLPLLMWGCATRGDLWQDLNRASRSASDDVCQTRLAVIGEIQTPEGTFHVAEQSLVLTGMLAPRGSCDVERGRLNTSSNASSLLPNRRLKPRGEA